MKRVLVCVDGSQYATSCCRYASWLCSLFESELSIVYVTDLRQFEVPFVADLGGSLGLQPYEAVMSGLKDLEDKKALLVLDQAEQCIRDSGFSGNVKKSHRTGFLVDSLKELERDADLIVLGKRGENANFATEHLGSTMERVARATTKPCFVASRSYKPIKKVLIAYKNVNSCSGAIDFLLGNKIIDEIDLHLASVCHADDEEQTLVALNEVGKRFSDQGIDINCQMLHGIASLTITDYAKENEIDLILMGSYTHSRIRRLILGSTTTEMLRDCRISSLLFR